MKDEKIAYIDVETTGTDPLRHGIVQIGGIIEINGREEHRFNYDMQPYPADLIDKEALEVIGKTEEELWELPKPSAQFKLVQKTLEEYVDPYDREDKFHFVAYNARFDDSFCRAWWRKEEDDYYGSFFYYPAIDVTNLVALRYLQHRHKFKNYKLMTVCKRLGMDIDEEEAHDAFYDILCTRDLFKALRKMVGWNENTSK